MKILLTKTGNSVSLVGGDMCRHVLFLQVNSLIVGDSVIDLEFYMR